MEKKEYAFWLSNIKNIGPVKIDDLMNYFGGPDEIFHAPSESLKKLSEKWITDKRFRFTDKDVYEIITSRDPQKIQREYANLEKNGIYFVSKEDDIYPEKLREIYAPPYALYYKGKLPAKKEKMIAIVGARNCSAYGMEMAKFFAGKLAKAGISIISGLARGIDSGAHKGVLSEDGITYGVLGCGIDICYPKENQDLYQRMQIKGGIISEYAPKIPPFAGNFPMRNRLISGLSDAVLVIEAKEKSGSLITVDMGLEQGKEIYALPGRVGDSLSEGCNNLIKMGAKLVTTPKDILEEMIENYEQYMDFTKKNNNSLETAGKIVYACLSLEPKHIDEIAYQTGLSVDALVEQLLMLELSGMAKQIIKNYYCIQ